MKADKPVKPTKKTKVVKKPKIPVKKAAATQLDIVEEEVVEVSRAPITIPKPLTLSEYVKMRGTHVV